MKNELSQNEKEFFLRQRKGNSKIRIVVIAVLTLLVLGLMIDALSGFYILRNSKSLFWGIGGPLLVSLFYLIGEAGSEWINSKDEVSHPLIKRVFHLFLLLCFVGGVGAAFWYVLKRLGW
jgi:hypothetical protein